MTRYILISFIVLFSFFQMSCSAISDAISAITSLDCDEWLETESDSSLSEICRELEGYLETDTSSFTTSLSQALPSASIVSSGHVFIQITDDEGDVISGITKDEVTVEHTTDNQTYTEVTVDSVSHMEDVSSKEASLAMVLDYSASITDSDLTDINYGLDLFYDYTFPTDTSSVYQSAVIKFSSDVNVVQDFTSTKSLLLTAVNDTSYEREVTSLYDAIYEGVDELKDESTALNLMVLFTDGMDNDSTHTKEEAISHAQTNEVPVCVIGVGFANVSTLQEIADDTGCFFVYKALFGDLDLAFETFADQINGFYMIDLDDSFNETSGSLRITVDVEEGDDRVISLEL